MAATLPNPTLPPSPQTPLAVYRSQRLLTLRFVTLVCAVPVPLTGWLLAQAPRASWADGPLPPALWWVMPLFLLVLAAALPASLLLLHDRYVLELDRTGPATWQLSTFLLWGTRRRELSEDPLTYAKIRYVPGQFDSMWAPSVDAPYLSVQTRTGLRLIFDMQGEWRVQRP